MYVWLLYQLCQECLNHSLSILTKLVLHLLHWVPNFGFIFLLFGHLSSLWCLIPMKILPTNLATKKMMKIFSCAMFPLLFCSLHNSLCSLWFRKILVAMMHSLTKAITHTVKKNFTYHVICLHFYICMGHPYYMILCEDSKNVRTCMHMGLVIPNLPKY